MSKIQTTDRVFIEILCKYKKNLKNINKTKEDTENEIDFVLKHFEKTTGKEIQSIKINKINNEYKLLLEIK